jgi:hypothetical protein
VIRKLSFLVLVAVSAGNCAVGEEVKAGREEGEYRILAGGKEIGTERYVIICSADSASSTSVVEFRNPGETHQKVQLETRLDMNGRFVPRAYELKTEVDGKKGLVVGSFQPNQAMFQYTTAGAPKKTGVLVGNEFTLLDTNVFHHFVFLARLYNFDSGEKAQRFEVVIPQESDGGFLKVSNEGRETISVRGKRIDTVHLKADSGAVVMNLWVDNRRVLHKISVPERGIDVVRN